MVNKKREPFQLTINEASRQIGSRDLSPMELMRSVLGRIDEVEEKVRAYVSVQKSAALESARIAEEQIKSGNLRGPLHGIPIAVKDIIDTAGITTASGSKLRANHVPLKDATVVSRLKRAGAIIIGKTVTHELAFEVFCPPTRNPWDLSRIAGGSSGGSAAAVATNMCMAAIGTDSGGSLRIPSAFCGVVGLKPTYGLVSKQGVLPVSWTLDHIGPITKCVDDCAIVLESMAGYDPLDSATISSRHFSGDEGAVSADDDLDEIEIGVPTKFFFDPIDLDFKDRFFEVIGALKKHGALLKEVTIPLIEYAAPALLAIGLTEPASYHEDSLRKTSDLIGDAVRTELEVGLLLPAKYYIKAQRFRRKFKIEMETKIFRDVDVLLTPTVPGPPPFVGETSVDIEGCSYDASQIFSMFCSPFNLTGQPALNLPCGLTSSGLPVGQQIIGRPIEEGNVFRVGRSIERAMKFSNLVPNL